MVDASSAIADHSRKKGKKAGQSETWHRIVERAQIVIVIVIIIIIIIIITIVVDPMLCEQSSDRNPVYLISSIHPSIAAAAAGVVAAVAAVAAAGTPIPGSRGKKKPKEETCILLLYTCQSRRG